MKAKLPIIGLVQTGKDTEQEVKTVEKLSVGELGAGFLDLAQQPLSGEKSISNKLIKSYYNWVYANVSVLSEEVSKIDFELYKAVLVGGEIEYKEIEQHPILDLLDKPNPFTTTSQAMYLTEAYQELAGDTFLLLDKPTNPTQFFILQPDKVEVIPGDVNDGYMIKGYKYKDTVDGKTTEILYDPELIIHIKTPNPANPYRGKSVVEASALTIDTDTLARTFIQQFFLNGASPNFALSSDQRITKDDIARIEAQMRKSYGGVKNAFKTMILGGGLKPVTVQQSGKEMQFLELQNAMRDELMAMFKNTKASLGIVEDVNRANAEASLESWKQSVIKPKMQRITDTLNEFLVPKFGTNLVLGFCDPVPENKTDDINQVTQIMASSVRQIMTVNEARSILDLDPLPDPEFDTIQAAQPITVAPPAQDPTPKSLKNINLSKVSRRMEKGWVAKDRKLYESAKEAAQAIVSSRPKKKVVTTKTVDQVNYHNFSHQQAKDYWQKQIHITEVLEKRFEEKLVIYVDALKEKAIKNLHNAVPKKAKKLTKAFDLFNEDDEIKAGINLFTPLAQEIAALAGTEAYKQLGLDAIYLPSKNIRESIASSVEKFATSMVSTDKAKLTDILASGIENGQSIPQIESAIRDVFDTYSKTQSKTVARTEILRFSNDGQLDAFKESGVVEGKQWFNGAPCPECAPYDGQIEWNLNGNFYDDTNEFKDGDPPLHPNCRCILLPVLSTDKSVELANRISADEKLINDLMAKNAEKEAELAEQKKIVAELEKIVEID